MPKRRFTFCTSVLLEASQRVKISFSFTYVALSTCNVFPLCQLSRACVLVRQLRGCQSELSTIAQVDNHCVILFRGR